LYEKEGNKSYSLSELFENEGPDTFCDFTSCTLLKPECDLPFTDKPENVNLTSTEVSFNLGIQLGYELVICIQCGKYY